jgi:hypothetical protein
LQDNVSLVDVLEGVKHPFKKADGGGTPSEETEVLVSSKKRKHKRSKG